MDVIMADKMDQALLKAAVALLKRCEVRLLQMNDMEDALHLLKLELPGMLISCYILLLERQRNRLPISSESRSSAAKPRLGPGSWRSLVLQTRALQKTHIFAPLWDMTLVPPEPYWLPGCIGCGGVWVCAPTIQQSQCAGRARCIAPPQAGAARCAGSGYAVNTGPPCTMKLIIHDSMAMGLVGLPWGVHERPAQYNSNNSSPMQASDCQSLQCAAAVHTAGC